MRGGPFHNVTLLQPIEEFFREIGAVTFKEHPTPAGKGAGFIDLFVMLKDQVVACEIELTPTRAVRDLEKARLIGADLLVIVTPTIAVAQAISRKIDRARLTFQPEEVWILPLGPALEQLRNKFS